MADNHTLEQKLNNILGLLTSARDEVVNGRTRVVPAAAAAVAVNDDDGPGQLFGEEQEELEQKEMEKREKEKGNWTNIDDADDAVEELENDLSNKDNALELCRAVAGNIGINENMLWDAEAAERAEEKKKALNLDKKALFDRFKLTNPFWKHMTKVEKNHIKWLSDNKAGMRPNMAAAIEKVL